MISLSTVMALAFPVDAEEFLEEVWLALFASEGDVIMSRRFEDDEGEEREIRRTLFDPELLLDLLDTVLLLS